MVRGTIPGLFKTSKLGLQLLRSLLMVACTAGNFIAVQYLRLDQTVSITFLAPLVVAALAGPVLGEYVGWHRALAIVAGFIGILIVVRPGFADHPSGVRGFARRDDSATRSSCSSRASSSASTRRS